MPRRWLLANKFSYAGTEYDTAGEKTDTNRFHPLTLVWDWQHVMVRFPFVFNVVATMQWTPGDWIFTWSVVAVGPISTEQQYRQYLLGPTGLSTYPIGFYYPPGSATSSYSDPGFDYPCGITGRCLTYSEE